MFALALDRARHASQQLTLFWNSRYTCEAAARPASRQRVPYSGAVIVRRIDGGADAVGTLQRIPPETAAYRDGKSLYQAKWTAPLTNRVLLEAGTGSYRSRYGGKQVPGLPTDNLIRVVEQCATGCAANGSIPGLTYRSGNWSSNVNWNNQWNAAMSIVNGTHSLN